VGVWGQWHASALCLDDRRLELIGGRGPAVRCPVGVVASRRFTRLVVRPCLGRVACGGEARRSKPDLLSWLWSRLRTAGPAPVLAVLCRPVRLVAWAVSRLPTPGGVRVTVGLVLRGLRVRGLCDQLRERYVP